MVLDFGKLNLGGSQRQTEPRKLFTILSKNPRFRRPSDEQGDVLDRWYEKRTRTDNTIKMNTGAGKTLVGLLALQSSLNEGVQPAVYVTPDNYLVEQVLEEARALGIQATDDVRNPDFIAGRSVLVINVMKLINGRSVFGVGDEGTKIRIGALVIDDAHACLETVADQFSLIVKNSHSIY
jgi:replicative superfamily II helicase